LLASYRFAVPQNVEALIERVADELGDTAFLTMRTGLQMVCLTRKEGSYPIKVVAMSPGTRRYLGLGVSGVALLAKMPRDEADAVLKENQNRFAEFGSASVVKVRHRVEFARRVGYAVSESYFTKGVGGIGVVIPTDGAPPVFSLSLVGLTNRLRAPRRDEVVSKMQHFSREIANLLNC
jgi:DNA-binding IclR family transcriptional regulator